MKLQIYDADIPSLELCKVQANHYEKEFQKQWKEGYSSSSSWKDIVMRGVVLYKRKPLLYTWYVCLPTDTSPVVEIYRLLFKEEN